MSTIDKSKMDHYIDGKLVKEGKKDEGYEHLNFQWWKAKPEDIAEAVQSTVKFLETHQSSRSEQLSANTRLYGQAQAFSHIGTVARPTASMSNPTSTRISFNLVSSLVDTLTAKIAKNRVTPYFATNGGDWDIQLKAEQLSQFVEGCFYETKMHEKGVQAFTDSAVWRLGIVHIDEMHDKIFAERAFPQEFLWDMIEAASNFPTQLHRIKICERNVLLACYPDKEDQEKIQKAMPINFEQLGATGTAADLVSVIESHHLPSNPDADEEETDGRHTLVIGDQWIVNQPYTKSYYPYVFRRYKKALIGFDGQSCAERVQSLQFEINREMILIQRSKWMGGSFKVLVENGSKVVSQHLNNEVGTIIHYSGTKPEYVTPPVIQQDQYGWVDSLIAKGYRQEGVSELEAASIKPLGVNSGKAMRTMANIADDRQLFTQQEQEEFYLECGRQFIEKAKDIYKRKKSYKVTFPTSTFARQIDWKDINLNEDQYVMKAFPKSSLADDLTGRMADIQEYMQAGLLSPRAGRRLMRKPDLEMADKLFDAAEDLLHKIFEEILSGKGYRAPEPYYDLVLAKELALEYYNYADYHNCPEDRLSLLRKFLKQIDDMTGVNAPPAPIATAPQAVPTAPPVSEILPNAPKVAA